MNAVGSAQRFAAALEESCVLSPKSQKYPVGLAIVAVPEATLADPSKRKARVPQLEPVMAAQEVSPAAR